MQLLQIGCYSDLSVKFPIVCSFPITYVFQVQQQPETYHFFSNHRSVNIRITVVLIKSSNIQMIDIFIKTYHQIFISFNNIKQYLHPIQPSLLNCHSFEDNNHYTQSLENLLIYIIPHISNRQASPENNLLIKNSETIQSCYGKKPFLGITQYQKQIPKIKAVFMTKA